MHAESASHTCSRCNFIKEQNKLKLKLSLIGKERGDITNHSEARLMGKIDLHLHTTYSDGSNTPKELIDLAKVRNVSTISITDHDCVDGYIEIKDYAIEQEIELIPGVEISSRFEGYEVHILGYYIDVHNTELSECLSFIQKGRISRTKKILHKLSQLGLPLEFEDVFRLTGNSGVIGRVHIANALIEQGYISDYQEAFNIYLGKGKLAYVPKPVFTPEKTFDLIKEAGGVSILAHPGTINNDFLIPIFKEQGLQGLEVFYPNHNYNNVIYYQQIASKYGLLMTGGSDYHGNNRKTDLFGEISLDRKYLNELKDISSEE